MLKASEFELRFARTPAHRELVTLFWKQLSDSKLLKDESLTSRHAVARPDIEERAANNATQITTAISRTGLLACSAPARYVHAITPNHAKWHRTDASFADANLAGAATFVATVLVSIRVVQKISGKCDML